MVRKAKGVVFNMGSFQLEPSSAPRTLSTTLDFKVVFDEFGNCWAVVRRARPRFLEIDVKGLEIRASEYGAAG